MNIVTRILQYLFALLLLMPAAGGFGFFPEPTAELYTEEGWVFMSALLSTGYYMPTIGVIALLCSLLFLINRVALAAVLLAPFTVNVILFHVFLDPAPISTAAIPAYILLALNVYFLYVSREKYRPLWR